MIYLLVLQKFRVRSPLNDRTKDPGKMDEHRCHKEKIQSLKCGVRQTTSPTKCCSKRLHFPILMHAHSTRGLPKLFAITKPTTMKIETTAVDGGSLKKRPELDQVCCDIWNRIREFT